MANVTQVKPSIWRRLWGTTLEARDARLAWLLILPTAFIVFGLILFPAVFSVWMSFRDVGLYNLGEVFRAPPAGFRNYANVVRDFAFKFQGLDQWGAAVTTIVYSFAATILTLVVGLIASILLNRPFRGRGLARK